MAAGWCSALITRTAKVESRSSVSAMSLSDRVMLTHRCVGDCSSCSYPSLLYLQYYRDRTSSNDTKDVSIPNGSSSPPAFLSCYSSSMSQCWDHVILVPAGYCRSGVPMDCKMYSLRGFMDKSRIWLPCFRFSLSLTQSCKSRKTYLDSRSRAERLIDALST